MSARYQARMSDDLLEVWDQTRLPEGMRVVEIGPFDCVTGSHLVTFDDDEAPEELSGQMVYPLLRVQPNQSVIIVGRDVVS